MKQKVYNSPETDVVQVVVEGVILSASTANEGYELGNLYDGIFEDE